MNLIYKNMEGGEQNNITTSDSEHGQEIKPEIIIEEKEENKGSLVVSRKRIYTIVLTLVLIILICLGFAFYFYSKSTSNIGAQNSAAAAGADVQKQLADTVAMVQKIAFLPQNDPPTLAIISDPTQLVSELFFKETKVGDRILIYPKTQKAVLYRPTDNKIVEMMTLSFCPIPTVAPSVENTSSTTSSTKTTVPTVKPKSPIKP